MAMVLVAWFVANEFKMAAWVGIFAAKNRNYYTTLKCVPVSLNQCHFDFIYKSNKMRKKCHLGLPEQHPG